MPPSSDMSKNQTQLKFQPFKLSVAHTPGALSGYFVIVQKCPGEVVDLGMFQYSPIYNKSCFESFPS